MRLSFAAVLFGAALALAPSASAQGAPSLLTTVGTPFPYRLDLPRDWEITRRSEMRNGARFHLLAAESRRASVSLVTADLLQENRDRLRGMPEPQMRRILTDMVLSSDSALLGLLRSDETSKEKGARLLDAVHEIRSLGGQRSAYARSRIEHEGESYSQEIHMTVKDGIMYVLTTTVEDDRRAAHDPLFARVRDSLVFAPAPQQ